ncbi:hypothetical protein RSO01_20730 [Reyranella soli]|uniref:DUF488 domain-containing protein n=1 Tax=Reyranella soli TaxID=1230389 RepID=A0A512N7E2_9HYPH|nr:hypothetical protein RSO01_20730 [Reyranella soli]
MRLLKGLGGLATNLDFQKLLFLYCQEPSTKNIYEFVPYKFGAFSFTSYADRRKLVSYDLLANDEHHWRLTNKGETFVGGMQDLLVAAFVARTNALRGDALVAETYRQFPYYAIKSEIAQRVLCGDKAALRSIRSSRPTGRHPRITTIGYEGRTLESYLNDLTRSGATVLCDVRRNPISRKYGFSKATLETGCERMGIRYEHLPELGISSEERQNLKTQQDYDALFANYEKNSLSRQEHSLTKIYHWMQAGDRVALTCYEREAHQCHRHCVAEAIERQFGKEFVAKHL